MDHDLQGHGLLVRTQDYTNFEWHPNSESYPDIARINYNMTIDSVPKDADDAVKAWEGKHAVVIRYMRIDRERKVMQAIGFDVVEAESTIATKDYFWSNEQPLAQPHGEWQWHLPDPDDNMQYMLNDDNTLLREVNYADPVVVETGDWSKNCKFNLAVLPKKELVASNIAPAVQDSINEQLAEIKVYFTADDCMYRSPVEKANHQVNVVCKFDQVTEVETPKERFGANVTLTMTWKITKDDVVGYVVASNEDEWQPAYLPPKFLVKNPASGDGAAHIISKYSNIQLIKETNGYMAMQTLTISGDFWEPFELKNYPFDIQPLGVVLESFAAQLDNVDFNCTSAELPQLRDTEWSGKGTSAGVKFAVDEGKKERGRYTLTIQAIVQRYYSVHMYRVVSVMALFSLASIAAFVADPDVNAVERLGLTFTLMLTATAYSLVIAAGLPKLGYLTFLDKYILATFAFIALTGAEITVLDWVAARHLSNAAQPLYDVEDALEYAAYVSLGLWFVTHIGLLLYVLCSVFPEERKKVDRKAVKAKKKAAKKEKAKMEKAKKEKAKKEKAKKP